MPDKVVQASQCIGSRRRRLDPYLPITAATVGPATPFMPCFGARRPGRGLPQLCSYAASRWKVSVTTRRKARLFA